jgi:hypothetical protein
VFEIVTPVAAASTIVGIVTLAVELSKIVIALAILSVNDVIVVTPVPVKFIVAAELSVQAVKVTPPELVFVLLNVKRAAVSTLPVSPVIVNAFVPAKLIVDKAASEMFPMTGAVEFVLLFVSVRVAPVVTIPVAILTLPVPAKVKDVKELSVKVPILPAPVPVAVLFNVRNSN